LRSPDTKNPPVRRGWGWAIDTRYDMQAYSYTLARALHFPIGSTATPDGPARCFGLIRIQANSLSISAIIGKPVE
jgi:hypothetical protein